MSFEFAKNEQEILKFWKKNKIFTLLQKKNKGKKKWSFLDGPITANNPMGVHHAWGRTYKDVFQRYWAMKGYDQRYQNGFDCQGLWVEVEVEKELGFKNKQDIEKFGIAKFVKACKERVLKYAKIQTDQSIRLGQWMDWDNSYYTMSDENNYAIWDFLKVCKAKDLLYKGHDTVPWCPRCGTSISQHEILSEEYKELTHKSVYVKFKIKGKKNTYFLAWTTTPWTLPGNVALAVNPKLEYVKVKKDKETYIVLKEKAALIDGKVIEKVLGKKLEGIEYEGIFDDMSGVKNHKVIAWKDVNEEEGTGVVHIAPGAGSDDHRLAQENKLEVVDLTNDESNYLDNFGALAGLFVASEEVREKIFKSLEKRELIFKIEDYTHRYPTCWRCKTELIFRLVDEWYIAMDPIRADLVKTAKSINWIPGFGLDRELDWLKNMHDWLISKKRYWGLALPIYECSCGEFTVIGSKKELEKRAVSGFEKFKENSPHRPFIDEVKIKCSKCDEEVSRIADVGTPWLDAGIIPFSTMKSDWFPAKLVCESFPGQFKNWFYSLIVMSTVLKGSKPVDVVFGFASVKDKNGEEMHKSKGNAILLDEAVEKTGADPMRWLYMRQNSINDLKFSYDAVEDVSKRLLTLYNVFTFFELYKEDRDYTKAKKSKNVLDKWIKSRLNNLIAKVTKNIDEHNVSSAVVAIEEFFIEDLSLWYVRRSRKRFKDNKEEIATLYSVLLDLSKLIAPIMPFFAEAMYQKLRTKEMPLSIHLLAWPKSGHTDKKLELAMERAREIVNLALSKRAEEGIKVRQPLAELKIKSGTLSKEILLIIREEVNVKKITFVKNIKNEVELDLKITEELKKEGEYREMVRNVNKIRKDMGLVASDKIIIDSTFEVSNIEELMKEINAKEFNVKSEVDGTKIKINGAEHYLSIKK